MYNLTQKVTEKNLFLFEFRNTLQACRLDRSVTTLRHPPKHLSETVQNRNLYKIIIQKKGSSTRQQADFVLFWLIMRTNWEVVHKQAPKSKPEYSFWNETMNYWVWLIQTRYTLSHKFTAFPHANTAYKLILVDFGFQLIV